MPIIITPGAFTRPSSFASLAERLGAQIVARPQRRKVQFDTGGLRSIAAALDCAIRDSPDDGTPLVLIGHSMGGLLSYQAGLTHRIDGQVLLMPAPPEGLALDMMRMAGRDPRSLLKFAAGGLSTRPLRNGTVSPPRGLYTKDAPAQVLIDGAAHRADESPLVLAQLLIGSRVPVHRATVPTLVVTGLQDGLVPPNRVRRLAGRLGADLLEFDVAHNFSEEPAGTVVEDAVHAWLHERSLLSSDGSAQP